MQISNAPAKLTEAWAAGGNKNVIPVPSQIPITPGAASWTDGFPPLTMTPVASGGIPPSGLDFNGLGNALSALLIWYNAGAGFYWDSTFQGNVSGYPIGARVLKADNSGYWRSTADNNTTNPDSGGAGWVTDGGRPVASVYPAENLTLASGSSKILYDTVEFDSYGLWDATNKRFKALWAGKYRISGATTFHAPAAQLLGMQIWHNGSAAKICSQLPQVSNVDLCLPFEGIINCAVNDYMEVYAFVQSTSVQAGTGGNYPLYVFAQCEYLGT